MKKYLCLILCLLVVLGGCATGEKKGDAEIQLDVEALAAYLAESDIFGERLYPLEEAVAANLYQLEAGVHCSAYCGTGATAEEAAVFETADADTAQTLLQQLLKRNENRIESYRNYLPGEVQKLENALIRTEGRYVVLCVAEDSTAAAELVEQALDPETDAAGALVQTA